MESPTSKTYKGNCFVRKTESINEIKNIYNFEPNFERKRGVGGKKKVDQWFF